METQLDKLKREELHKLMQDNSTKLTELRKQNNEIQKFIDYSYKGEIDALPNDMSKLTPEQINLVFNTKIKDGKLQLEIEKKREKYLSDFYIFNFTNPSKKETYHSVFDLMGPYAKPIRFHIDFGDREKVEELVMDVDCLFTLLPKLMLQFSFNPSTTSMFGKSAESIIYNNYGIEDTWCVRKADNKLYISGWEYSKLHYTSNPILVFKRFIEGVTSGNSVIYSLKKLIPNKIYILNSYIFKEEKKDIFYAADSWVYVGKGKQESEYIFKKSNTKNIDLKITDQFGIEYDKDTGEAFRVLDLYGKSVNKSRLVVAIQLP